MIKLELSKSHKKVFKKMGINIVYLFGSQSQKYKHKLSDFDIGVVFSSPEDYKNCKESIYLKLYDIFTDILPKKYLRNRFKKRLHEFDIVFLQFSSISLQFEAIQGKVLYQKDEEERLNYEEYILKRYCDLSYFRKLQYKSTLNRI